MEEQLKIRVDVQTATLGEMRDRVKELNKEMLTASRDVLPSLVKESQVLKNEIDMLKGGVGALHRTYIEGGVILRKNAIEQQNLAKFIGENRKENRMQNFLLNESKGSILAVAGSLDSLTGITANSSAGMKQFGGSLTSGITAFQGFDFAAKALTTTLGLVGQTANVVSLVISGLAAAGVAIAAFFREANKESEKAASEGLTDFANKLKEISDKSLQNQLSQINELIFAQQQIIASEKGKLGLFGGTSEAIKNAEAEIERLKERQSLLGKESFARAQEKQQMGELQLISEEIKELDLQRKAIKADHVGYEKEILALTDKIVALTEKKKNLETSSVDVLKKQTEEQKKQTQEYQEWGKNLLGWTKTWENSFKPIREDIKLLQTSKGLALPPVNVREVSLSPSDLDVSNDVLNQNIMLVDVLRSGFQSLGSAIQHDFIDKIIGSTSLFQKFVGGVVGGIIQIAEQLASSAIIAGILSWVTGGPFGALFGKLSGFEFAQGGVINEPVFGIGSRSGKSYLMGESGAERVTPLTSFGNNLSPQMIYVTGEFKADGRNLMSVWKSERIIERKRGSDF